MAAAYRRYGSERRPGPSWGFGNRDDNDDYDRGAESSWVAHMSYEMQRKREKDEETERRKDPEYLLNLIYQKKVDYGQEKIAELVEILNKSNYSDKPLNRYLDEPFLLFLVDNGLKPFPNLNIIKARAFVKNCDGYHNNFLMSLLDKGLDVNSRFTQRELQLAVEDPEKNETMLDFYMRQLQRIQHDPFKATIEKNGVYDFNMEGEEVVLDKHNTMDKKNINFSSGI
jgi:hypothetical protein